MGSLACGRVVVADVDPRWFQCTRDDECVLMVQGCGTCVNIAYYLEARDYYERAFFVACDKDEAAETESFAICVDNKCQLPKKEYEEDQYMSWERSPGETSTKTLRHLRYPLIMGKTYFGGLDDTATPGVAVGSGE